MSSPSSASLACCGTRRWRHIAALLSIHHFGSCLHHVEERHHDAWDWEDDERRLFLNATLTVTRLPNKTGTSTSIGTMSGAKEGGDNDDVEHDDGPLSDFSYSNSAPSPPDGALVEASMKRISSKRNFS
eukprot:GSA25T00018855001.1